MKALKLYVDESGNSYPKNYQQSPYYILVGCIIEEGHQAELKIKADQIKFKYWGNTNLVFHSTEIARETNDFKIFKNNLKLKQEFYKDLYELLRSARLQLVICVVDKQKVIAKQWDEKIIVRETADRIVGDFVALLFSRLPCNGKIIFEASNGFKDQIYLAAFNYYLSPNFPRKDPDFINVRQHLTSINFVTKQNHDIETQLADLFAYAARSKYERDEKIKQPVAKSYEETMIGILETKLVSMPANIGPVKKKYLKKINSFCKLK